MLKFEKKVVLIIGASGGLGSVCAEYFAKEGALLSLVGRNPDKFIKLLEKFKENGIETEPLTIYADISVDAERILNETFQMYDRLDILINNAGFSIPASLETIKMQDYDAIMATNVRGVVELSQLAIPYLVATKGNIINISSIEGAIPVSSAYAISKACLDQFTKCAAMELAGKGVRVNSVTLSFIKDTDFHTISKGVERDTDDFNELVEQAKLKHPLQRICCTDDVVYAISFLADEGTATFITGIFLHVDGGVSTKGTY